MRRRFPRAVPAGALLLSGLFLLSWTAGSAAQEPHQHETAEHQAMGGHDAHAHHQAPKAGDVDFEEVEGLSIPDVAVLTQDGEEVSFYSDLVKDKVVAMNFIFTTCTTICPPLGANFGKLQQLLGDRLEGDVRLISVSVDPVTDTPQRMKAWGDIFGAGPGWTLVTGKKDEVTKLLKALQVFTPDINDHSPVVLVGDGKKGAWTRAYGLAPPAELAKMLEDLEKKEAGGGE